MSNFKIVIPTSSKIVEAIKVLLACVSKDEGRPNLNALLFEKCSSTGGLNLVSADGHALFRLRIPRAFIKGSIPDGGKWNFDPPKIKKAKKYWNPPKEKEPEISITVNDGYAEWTLANGDIIPCERRMVSYPDYRSAIPRKNWQEYPARFALGLARIPFDKDTKGVRIECGINGTSVFALVDGVDGNESIPLLFDPRAGNEIPGGVVAGFNPHLWAKLEPLSTIPQKWCMTKPTNPIALSFSLSSAVVKETHRWGWDYVQMPIRLTYGLSPSEDYLSDDLWELPRVTPPSSESEKGGKNQKELATFKRALEVEKAASEELAKRVAELEAQLEAAPAPAPAAAQAPAATVHVVEWDGDEAASHSIQGFIEMHEDDGIFRIPVIGTTDQHGHITLSCLEEFVAGFRAYLEARGFDEGWVYAPLDIVRAYDVEGDEEVDATTLQA